MKTHRCLIALVPLLTALWATAVLADQDVPEAYLQGLGELHHHEIEAPALGRSFHVFVRRPTAIEWPLEARADARLPTLYILDGGAAFPALAGQYHYLRLGQEVPPLLMVAISYGASTFTEGNYRQTDFTAPAADRDFWGGAPAFQAWLADELQPFIEAQYPSDPGQRLLFGQSLGGQFVLYSALTRPTLFAGHMASNPALHRNLDWFLAVDPPAGASAESTRLMVSLADGDAAVFRDASKGFLDFWSEAPHRPFELRVTEPVGHSHFSSLPEALTRSLRWLLPPPGDE